VVFDLDGTLVDSFPWFLSVLPEVAARHGFRAPADAAEGEALRLLGPREILARLGVAPWRLPLIAAEMRRRKRAAGALPLFRGVPAMLGALHAAGVPLGLGTSDTAENARLSLGAECMALIRHQACGAPLLGKARLLRRLLRASGTPPAAALMIGDEVRDAEAAREAGMGFAAAGWGYNSPAALRARAPLAVFGTVAEIVPFVLGEAGA
jgi:phosphoglycolate phosphatase